MREAVAVVLMSADEIFMVERQDYLPSFPGYFSFPGGLVDRADEADSGIPLPSVFQKLKPIMARALLREIKEECGVDLTVEALFRVRELGEATTPSFNPYRFKTSFILVELASRPDMKIDHGEIKRVFWRSPRALYERFLEGRMLAVPPTIELLKNLSKESYWRRPNILDLNLRYDEERLIPMIEPVRGIKQFLPLSHTFPPANRTNCFLLGERLSLLIDPSPKDEKEYRKLLRSLRPYKVDRVFITHHHPDHHEHAPELAKELRVPLMMSEWTRDMIIECWGRSYFLGSEVKIVKDGEHVTTWQGQEVVAHHLPGHDEGQLGLSPEKLDWFIVSDLIQTIGTVVISAPEGNMKSYFASLEKVIALNPKVIFPSHGIGLGGVYKLQETLKHRQEREGQIRELLTKTQNIEDIFQVIYPNLDYALKRYALKTIEAHVQKLSDEAKENLSL